MRWPNHISETLRDALERGREPHAASVAAMAVMTGAGCESVSLARSDTARSIDSRAVFLVYSITKSMMAATALRLVASGELALDVPIARWIPAAPHAERITLRQLLRHTSGLPDYGGSADYRDQVRKGAEPWSDEEYLEKTRANRLIFEPDRGWGYSNVGYMLVRLLLQTVRRDTFENVLRAEVFHPLGLESAFVPQGREDLRKVTLGSSPYLGGDGPPVDVAERYHPGWVAHGVVATTASEVATFYHRLLAGELLPPDLLDQMREPSRIAPPGREPWITLGYGLGLQIETGILPEPIYGHTGGGPGCSASACAVGGKSPATVVVLSDGEDVVQVEHMVIEALTGRPRKSATM